MISGSGNCTGGRLNTPVLPLSEPTEVVEFVSMEDDSEEFDDDDDDEGPMIDRAVGRSTKPWKRPKMTVREKTLKKVWKT